MQKETAEKVYTFRIGSNPVGRMIFADTEADAWEQINEHNRNSWVELEHVQPNPYREAICRHCGRSIVRQDDGIWVDPEATGDDSIWREVCDEHDTMQAEHEPVEDEDHGAEHKPAPYEEA